MAAVPQVSGEGDIFAAIATTGRIPERYLKRGMDNLSKLGFITRGSTRFLSPIFSKYPKSKVVNTREHKIQEINELDRVIDVTVSSASTDNHVTVGVSNNHAAQLIVNDMLYVKGLYMEVQYEQLQYGQVYAAGQTSTVNTQPATYIPPALGGNIGNQPTAIVYSQTFGQSATSPTTFFTNYEPMLLVAKGARDSAGTGSTTLTFQRCWCSSGGTDQGGWIVATHAPALVTTATNTLDAGKIIAGTHQLLRGLPNFPEGGDAPSGLHANPYMDNNFTQEFKYAVEITNESLIEKTYLNKSYLEIEKMIRARQSALDMERTFLFGRKGKSMDAMGRVMYTMGGVVEFIKRDTDHILKYTNPSLTYTGMLDVLGKVFNLGGGQERDMYMGLELYTEFKKAFYSSGYMRYDEQASKSFDIEVEELIGAAGKVRVIPCYTLSEAGFGNKALVIDDSLGAFIPTTHDGWDMKTEKDIQAKGQQIYKEQLVGIKGLERRYQQFQSIIEFSI